MPLYGRYTPPRHSREWSELKAIADWRERRARKRWLRRVHEKSLDGYQQLRLEWGLAFPTLIASGVAKRNAIGPSPLWARNAWFVLAG